MGAKKTPPPLSLKLNPYSAGSRPPSTPRSSLVVYSSTSFPFGATQAPMRRVNINIAGYVNLHPHRIPVDEHPALDVETGVSCRCGRWVSVLLPHRRMAFPTMHLRRA